VRNTNLSDDNWRKILFFLETQRAIHIGAEYAFRKFVDAVLRILRSGGQWRLLPPERGKWNSVYKRFARWGEKGVRAAMHRHFADDPDMESVMVDGTIMRAHTCAVGAKQGHLPEPLDQILGRSACEFKAKIHVMVDALGNPLDFILTGGQAAVCDLRGEVRTGAWDSGSETSCTPRPASERGPIRRVQLLVPMADRDISPQSP
jgi:transposase